MVASIWYPYALSELIVSGILVLLSIIVSVYGAYHYILSRSLRSETNSKGDRSRTPGTMRICLFFWWQAVIIKAIFRLVNWTDIIIPFNDACYEGHCSTCLIRGKLLYVVFAVHINSILILFYNINLEFQSRTCMTRFRVWMVFLGIFQIMIVIAVLLSTCGQMGHVIPLTHSGNRAHFACTFDSKEIKSNYTFPMMVPVKLLLELLTLIVLNTAFIWKSYRIWNRSNLHQLESVEKYQKLDRAISVIIRHCILAILLICVLITRLTTFVTLAAAHYSQSMWWDIVTGTIIFMFFPFMDKPYQILFSRIHQVIFRKWKARYLEHVQRIAARNLYLFMLKMHKDMFKERPSVSSLRPVFEDEARHKMQEEFEAKYNEELQLSITQIMTSSCRKSGGSDCDEENPFSIDFDYKHVLGELDRDARRTDIEEQNPIDAVVTSTVQCKSWPAMRGNDAAQLDTDVVLQLGTMQSRAQTA